MILKNVDITLEIGDKVDKLATFFPNIYIGKNKPDKIAKTLITKFKIFVTISSLFNNTQKAPPNVIEKVTKAKSSNKL